MDTLDTSRAAAARAIDDKYLMNTDEARALQQRFATLPESSQIAIALELEVLWPDDYGLPLREQQGRFFERIAEHGLFPHWHELMTGRVSLH
jgi:hypothetical protein